jgi:hypothetical protein
MVALARADEAEELARVLSQRATQLNVQVRIRDQRIGELEKELAALQNADQG